LFKALISTRNERGTLLPALSSDAPVGSVVADRIVEYRQQAEEGYQETLRRLSATDLPDRAAITANLQRTHDSLAAARQKADAAEHLAKSARDPSVIADMTGAFTAWIDAVTAANDTVEVAVKLYDPMIDELLLVKQSAWAVRNYYGGVMFKTQVAAASGQPWTQAEIVAMAEDRGRADLAWKTLSDAASRPDMPQNIVASVAKTKQDFIGYLKGEWQAYIDTLNAGKPLIVALEAIEKRNVAAGNAAIDTIFTVLRTMIDWADQQSRHAERNLALNMLALLSAVCFGASGYLVASLRIAQPIRMMTNTMRRLAEGELAVGITGAGRGDEIGAMAAAVHVFRDEMVHAQKLTAQAAEARETEARLIAAASAAREAEAAQQAQVVEALARALAELAEGDLTVSVKHAFAPAYEKLRVDFNAAVAGLRAALQEITTHSEAIDTGTKDIAAAADDLAGRTETQAAGLQQTAAALDEVTATVRQTAEGSGRAQSVATTAKAESESSGKVVAETVTAMGEIEASAKQIGQIIGVIDEIAFQTNLLALNAGVEAARAGEAGRGFAVVAQEVRALAQRAADAAKEIKVLVNNSMQQVERGVRLVGKTGEALHRIQAGIAEINHAVAEIAASAREQAIGLSEVNNAVNQMDQTTQQNAAMVEQSTAAAHSLARETAELNRAVGRFRVAPEATRRAA